ncbi:hypothetical protein ACIPVB_03385 [Microbacterium sp. NPDC090007]|uniref:hypothetical protein n=1 Tax=Microbacterium sp. NPDC090007 TaxID=3364204 RepID=UPI0037FA3BCE
MHPKSTGPDAGPIRADEAEVLPPDERFDALTSGLIEGVRSRDDLAGLVLLGSASDAGEYRRDEWSDHDFFVLTHAGRGEEARADLGWLPDRHRVVLIAREGAIGFVAMYDDGHVFEFALAEPPELAGAVAGDASVVVDSADVTARLVAAGQQEAAARDAFDPVNDTNLLLVKIFLGMGRTRRGEVVNGGQFVRFHAVTHLVRAIRALHPGAEPGSRDRIDPTRRFEQDYPEWAAEIADALDRPVADAARSLFDLAVRILRPGWDEFPDRAADAIRRRLAW